MKRTLYSAVVFAAVAGAIALSPSRGRAQVIGIQPLPQVVYCWDSATQVWVRNANASQVAPYGSTPEPIAYYGYNSALGQYTPFLASNGVCPGSGGGLTLTTTGSSGAATLSGDALNIPQYQGALTLTTTGSSGAATLLGDTLNIPQYSSGSGSGGNIPSNARFVFTGDSINWDDAHALSSPIAITAWSTTGGVTTVTNSGTNHLAAGQWVSMYAATSWPAPPSTLTVATGYTIFQVLSTGLSATQFEINTSNIAPGTCSASCGNAYSASLYLPFATATALGMPSGASANTYLYLANPVSIAGTATNFSAIFDPLAPNTTGVPAYLIIEGYHNDAAGCASAATIEGNYQTIFQDAHADGYKVVVASNTAVNWTQQTCNTLYNTIAAVDAWLRDQGKETVQSSSPGSTAYWDLYSDLGAVVNDPNDSALVASNGGMGPKGAKLASIQLEADLYTGNGRAAPRSAWTFGYGQGATNTGSNGYVYSPSADASWIYQWWNAARTTEEVAFGTLPTFFVRTQFNNEVDFAGAISYRVDASGNGYFAGLNLYPLRSSSGSQCIQIDTSGNLSNTGAACGSGGGVSDTTVAVTGGTQGANSCSTTTNVTMTGLSTSMVVHVGYTGSPVALTGWGATGGMVFHIWPSATNTATWEVCNQTASSITYSSITFNVGAN